MGVSGRIEVIQADITRLPVDAIVNAANSSLRGGGGVDGAIHRGAGPELLAACRDIGGCPTGEARITHGYLLPARWVIHTVGPVWHGGERGEPELLAACYRNVFALVKKHGLRTVGLPSISTGAYRYPLELAAQIAVKEIRRALTDNRNVEKVTIACFDERTYEAYDKLLKKQNGSDTSTR